MSKPKASICIPTYNQGQFLGDCLRSALSQTYEDFEVVLSVNHCTDNTEEVVAQFANEPRLRIVRPERFLSAGENFRFVLSQARGEYVNFLSSDDMLYPEFLHAQIGTLDAHPDVAFSFTASEFIDADGRIVGINFPLSTSYIKNGKAELKRYIYRLRATGIALLIRRSMYEMTGGITTEIVDWEACIKLLCLGNVSYCARVLAQVRSWTSQARSSQRIERINGFRIFFEDCERYVVAKYPELGPLFADVRKQWAAREALALRDYPKELQEKALQYTLALSDAPDIRLRLALYEKLWIRRMFLFAQRADTWTRFQAKKVLAVRARG